MTQTGKCDTCRSRKVKCDEKKPKCTACAKRDRPCTYTYGKASAFVVEDPNQMSKHGKPRVAPLVFPLVSYDDSSSSSSPSQLRLTTEREAEKGQGIFNTFTPASKAKYKRNLKPSAHQRRKLEAYLKRLHAESAIIPLRPASVQSTLAARYIHMLGSEPFEHQPLAIMGSWISSIPARLGSSPVLDLAVEYTADSFSVYWEDNFSRRSKALATKARALKELQLAISAGSTEAPYDLLLAMKLHYSAEFLMGFKTLYHTIHAGAIAEILKTGRVIGIDNDHYWNFVDNTYYDDVAESMLAGRTSVYDNEIYLTMTYPPNLAHVDVGQPLSVSFRASASIMHCFIQLPRLVCLVRCSVAHPENTEALAAAVCLAESLIEFNPYQIVQEVIKTTTAVVPIPPSSEISDIVPDSFQFDSIQSMMLLTRYWMLQIQLSAVVQALHRHFPEQTAMSALPKVHTLLQVELDGAMQLARSLYYSTSTCPSFPLVSLRIHTPLQVSMGSWYRLIQHLTASELNIETTLGEQRNDELLYDLETAKRMQQWVCDACNQIHETWNVPRMTMDQLLSATEAMAGGEIPDWMPIRVRFENEGEEMVMKLDYEMPTPIHRDFYDIEPPGEWTRSTTSVSPFNPKRKQLGPARSS